MKKYKMNEINVSAEAQSYSNISGVLAGFSLAAILLMLGGSNPIDEKIIIMFFVAFTGFIASAFSFALASRFAINNKRQNSKNFILGYATAIPIILMLSGLSSLIEVFVKSSIAFVYNSVIFIFVVFMIPSFTIAFAKKSWNPVALPRGEIDQRRLYKLAYLPIVIACIIRVVMYFYEKSPW